MRFLSALLFLVSCSCCGAQEKAAPTGLKAAGEDLVSLLTFELDKKGAFRLKRDHWKASFEEPEPEPKKEERPADGAAPNGRAARLQRLLDIQQRQAPAGFGGMGMGDFTEDPVSRLKSLIDERQDETVEILRSWIEEPEGTT